MFDIWSSTTMKSKDFFHIMIKASILRGSTCLQFSPPSEWASYSSWLKLQRITSHSLIKLKKMKWCIWLLASRLKYSMFFPEKVGLIKLTKLIYSHSWKSIFPVKKKGAKLNRKRAVFMKYTTNLATLVREADSDNEENNEI